MEENSQYIKLINQLTKARENSNFNEANRLSEILKKVDSSLGKYNTPTGNYNSDFWQEWNKTNKSNNMQSTTTNWVALVVAILAGLTPLVVGEEIKTWFGLSESGINIVRGVFAVAGTVIAAYNGLQIQKKTV